MTVEEAMKLRPRPYGWEVMVRFYGASQKPDQEFHWRGSASRARRNAMLKTNADSIISMKPYDEEAYIRAFGMVERWTA